MRVAFVFADLNPRPPRWEVPVFAFVIAVLVIYASVLGWSWARMFTSCVVTEW